MIKFYPKGVETMKNFVKIGVALLLIFGLTVGGKNNSVQAAPLTGGYVAATTTFSGVGYSSTTKTVDMFMSTSDANAYAAKLNSGWKASIAWTTAGFMVGVGPYVTIIAAVDTITAQKAAADITKLTSKNKKVQITLSSALVGPSIKEWNGVASTIQTSAPASKTTSYGGITAYTKTTVNKRELKY